MDEKYQALKELQDLDREIEAAKAKIEAFAPKLEELEAPLVEQEREVSKVRSQVAELRQEARRLERGAEDKRAKLQKYEERLDRVRTAREEAAARTELDLIRRAAEADEEDAVEVMEQVTRAEIKLEEMEKRLEEIREELEPKRQELLDERAAAEEELAVLRGRRENQAVRVDAPLRELYERVSAGRTKMVLAQLTEDGACGHCFSMIPIQQQNELRTGDGVHRCEACGVILYAED